jgi:Methyltransferase domain
MCAEILWDAPSRFGASGRAARLALQRLLRPALVRQAAIDDELRGQLVAQQQRISALDAAITATGGPGDLGDLQYRVDVLERRYELAQARSLLPGATMPADGERITVVTHDWEHGEERRVLCSSGTGAFASLLEVTAVGLEIYARRHRWDLVLSREDVSDGRPPPWGKLRLTESLLGDYQVVAWIDCDALIVDFEHDLGEVLEDGKDFYVVEQEGGIPRDCVVNSGVFVIRASRWAERFLSEVWAQEDLALHRWWENAAIMRVLGYQIEASPVVRGEPTPWMERVKLIDLAWNSIPYWARSARPRINHYGALAVPRRRLLMLDDLTRTLVRRRSSDPLAHVDSREDLPLLFNRLGLIGTGVEIGVQTGNYSAWILHRWAGMQLISIDPWASEEPDLYVDVANVEQRRHDDLFASTMHRLAPFGDRSAIWRMTGEQAATHLDDRSLDFVYLDARHDEASLADDLSTWEPKVRLGGIIAGHDYLDGDLPEGRFGVKTAVDRFFGARGLEIHETVADRPWSSWWVLLPATQY